MKNKDIFLVLASIVLLMGLFPYVSSISLEETQLPESSLNPERGVGYALGVFFDDVKYFFASPNEKLETGLGIADKRLSEMSKLNDIEQMQKVEENRQRILNKTMRDADNEEETEQIRERLQKHQRVLEQVRERVPEQAKQGIDTAIENSQRGMNRIQGMNFDEKGERVEQPLASEVPGQGMNSGIK